MLKKKLKELRMNHNNSATDAEANISHKNFTKNIKKVNINQKIENPKRNLPELRIAKLKNRLTSEIEKESNNDESNNNIKTNNQINNQKKPKSKSLMKNKEVIFPKINKNGFQFTNNENKKNFINNIQKHNITNANIHYNSHLKIHNTQSITNKNNNNNNINTINLNIQKNKNNNLKPPSSQRKLHQIKKEKTNNIIDNLNLFHPLIPNSNNLNNTNSLLKTNNHTNIISIKNTSNSSLNNNNNNNINNNNTLNQKTNSVTNLNKELQELTLMNEKLNMLKSLFNSITGTNLSPFTSPTRPKTVEVSPSILTQTFKNYTESICSLKEEFNENDFIKCYAYNTSQGNIRDYNEDTITCTKINTEKESFHFFAVYDGHGGEVCSKYLKDNLYKFIKDFSKDSLKSAIDEAENDFIKNYALNEKGELKDSSGSCGVMCMIKNNKLIIANVGDSRLVVFRDEKLYFATEDHKPGADFEKARIESNGGKIYQTPTLFPLYQNGIEIEIPWRVLPGRLSVSRTFGDIEAKDERFGGMKNVVAALPDITEIDLDEEFNFIIIGCDGIFDVLSNDDIMECVKIVLKEKKGEDKEKLAGEIAGMIIKSSLAKDSFDNVSVIFILLNIDKINV